VSTALPSSPLPTCVGCSQTAIALVTLFWKTMPAANCAPLGPRRDRQSQLHATRGSTASALAPWPLVGRAGQSRRGNQLPRSELPCGGRPHLPQTLIILSLALSPLGRAGLFRDPRSHPPGVTQRGGTCHNALLQVGRVVTNLINAAGWRPVRWKGRPRILTRDKEKPRLLPGL
jgi:hypothetical protein